MKTYENDFRKKIENEGNPNNYNVHEIDALAKGYATFHVRREQKHLKAYLKGVKFYKLYGRIYQVLTNDIFESENNKISSVTKEDK